MANLLHMDPMADYRGLLGALKQAQPVGGGLLGVGQRRQAAPEMRPLERLALGTMFVPGIGDVAGLAADADMYATDPESRNWLNYGLTAAGLLPVIPGASAIREILTGYRGGKGGFGASEGKGLYVSRSPGLASAFGDVSEVKYLEPENPLIVDQERVPIMDDEFDIFAPAVDSDSEWIRMNKEAAQASRKRGVTEDKWDDDIVSDELTRIIRGAGYDAVDMINDNDRWHVLFDPTASAPGPNPLGLIAADAGSGAVRLELPDGTSMGVYDPGEVSEAMANLNAGYTRSSGGGLLAP